MVKKLSCNSDEGNCILEKCSLCKSSESIDDIELDSLLNTDSSSENNAKNTVLSPNFLVWKFCGKTEFPHSFGRFLLLADS